MNCCLFDVQNVLSGGGFDMGNIWYRTNRKPWMRPLTLSAILSKALPASSTAVLRCPAWTLILEPYAQKSFDRDMKNIWCWVSRKKKRKKWPMQMWSRKWSRGFQGWEYKFNTVGQQPRGLSVHHSDCGHGNRTFCEACHRSMLKVRRGGTGERMAQEAGALQNCFPL